MMRGDTERIEARTPEDWRKLLGRRVSLRISLEDPEHPFSEVLGTVMSVKHDASGGQYLVVVTKRGEHREVPVGSVLAGKVWI